MPHSADVDPYDRVPYPDLVHASTHPDRLAVIGALFGLTPAPVRRCRVLEIGCGSGLNVIAMAEGLPGSRFVGIDASPRHVARASSVIERLGLQNVEVLQRDLRSFDPHATPYDYVVAHGIYSWIDDPGRRALLRLVRAALADQGIAFVSYNTYPGWFMLRAIREMMLYHGRRESDPLQRVARASELVQCLVESLDVRSSPYAAYLAGYQRAMENRESLVEAERIASILHDELSPVNEPVFFHQFAAEAADAGLQYMAEADLRGSTPADVTPDVQRRVRALATDLISLEQYMDFVVNRAFRQTLLCLATVRLSRTLRSTGEVLRPFYLSTSSTLADGRNAVRDRGALRVAAADGRELVTDHPLSIAAFTLLASVSPRALSWDDLIERSTALVEREGGTPTAQEDRDTLAGNILQAFTASRSLVRLGTLPDRFVSDISARPAAFSLARLLARDGSRRVPNGRHERVVLGPLAMELVPHLDGTRSLVDVGAIDEQARQARAPDAPSDHPDEATLTSLLAFLARSALLQA